MGKQEEEPKEEPKEEKKPDFFRNPIVRYLAYSHEFGNALATYTPCGYGKFWCYFSKITHSYILIDTISKGHAAFLENKDGSKPHPLWSALDRYCWHMMASILLPKYTMYGVRQGLIAFSNFARVCHEPFRTYFVTALALAAIPIIIEPIDSLTDHIMDNSYRQANGTAMSCN